MIHDEIEAKSFQIILQELGAHTFSEQELAIVLRIIHASADFDFAKTIRFSSHAIMTGIQAIKQGCHIITDVHMVEAGISRSKVKPFNCDVICAIDSENVQELAQEKNITRAAASIMLLKEKLPRSIIAIGNAPTALLEVLRIYREENIKPLLVIGMPVGFVQASEAKDLLNHSDLEFITNIGRKGGSPIAAACVNALLQLAKTV